jgi:Lipocalin-like domain
MGMGVGGKDVGCGGVSYVGFGRERLSRRRLNRARGGVATANWRGHLLVGLMASTGVRWATVAAAVGAGWRRLLGVGLVACGGLFSVAIAAATGDVSPTGVWQVVDYFATDPATGVVTHPFGENPIGSAIYTAKGHMSVLVAGSHRVPSSGTGAKRAEERAGLFDGLYAYTGTYTVKGNTVTIHVESAWQPDWVGTEKVRTLKLDHRLLSIVTERMTSPVDGKTYISTTTFRRVE